jgi:hypothetical protein
MGPTNSSTEQIGATELQVCISSDLRQTQSALMLFSCAAELDL